MKNKFEKQKPRTLSQRSSGEEAKRCLSQAMDNAAEDKMDEEEMMIPDNEYGKPSETAPGAQPDPQLVAQATGEQNIAATDNMDFWTRMECLMERKTEKINATVETLGSRIDQVKEDLEISIAEEGKKRDNRRASTPRWTRCSAAPRTTQTRHDDGAWKPQHNILGGWTTKLQREHLEGASKRWWNKLDEATRQATLRP